MGKIVNYSSRKAYFDFETKKDDKTFVVCFEGEVSVTAYYGDNDYYALDYIECGDKCALYDVSNDGEAINLRESMSDEDFFGLINSESIKYLKDNACEHINNWWYECLN